MSFLINTCKKKTCIYVNGKQALTLAEEIKKYDTKTLNEIFKGTVIKS